VQFFRDLSIRGKLFAGFGVVLALCLGVGAVSISSLSSVDRAGAGIYTNNAVSLDHLGVASTAFAHEQGLVLRGLVYPHDQAIQGQANAGIATDQATVQKELQLFVRAGLTPQEKVGMATLRPAEAAYLRFRDRVRSLTQAGQVGAASSVNQQTTGAFDTVVASLGMLTRVNETQAAAASRDIDSTYTSSRTQTIVLLVVTFLLGLGIAFLLSRSIKRGVDVVLDRLVSLRDRCVAYVQEGLEAFAGGDLTKRYEPVTAAIEDPSQDELGQIAAAVNDLAQRVSASLLAYNATAQSLSDTIGQVAATAGSVGDSSKDMAETSKETGRATGEIAHAVGDVAVGTERQVRMIEAAKTAADEVARAVAESAENASETAAVAVQARQFAQDGVTAAEQANKVMQAVSDSSNVTSEAMGGLAAKSEQIGAIVNTITGIAEQTNLLALNAAIEAARAGEQGRGFAVVAEEVRKLAEGSQRAAQEISGLIGAIQTDTAKAVTVVEDGARRTQEGSAVVEQTREAFVKIGGSVDDITARIEQIAAASAQIAASAVSMQEHMSEAAAVAEESSASTEQVSASTQETSASAEQIASSAQELSGNAEQLNALVAQFTLTRS
jgi:methyl-accepting chemotaxis protein